jgi:two-component system, oxyanion-binding sensor
MTAELAGKVAEPGRLSDPKELGAALAKEAQARKEAGRKLRFGVVHRYSSHNYMLRYWLAGCGIRPDEDVEIATVAPPFVAEAMEAGEIDGACVGEPWNSKAVARGAGVIVLATAQIWRRGVEKVLAFRAPVLEARRPAAEALIRAMRRAGAHFIDPTNWEANADILARPQYIGADRDLILGAISDRLVLQHRSQPVHYRDFMFQYREAANFPWVSQAEWLYTQLIRWDRIPFSPEDAAAAARVFRPDVYRSALTGTRAPLPGASSKVEGSLSRPTAVTTQQGEIVMENNSFFDGRTFDPDDLEGYINSFA